ADDTEFPAALEAEPLGVRSGDTERRRGRARQVLRLHEQFDRYAFAKAAQLRYRLPQPEGGNKRYWSDDVARPTAGSRGGRGLLCRVGNRLACRGDGVETVRGHRVDSVLALDHVPYV